MDKYQKLASAMRLAVDGQSQEIRVTPWVSQKFSIPVQNDPEDDRWDKFRRLAGMTENSSIVFPQGN